MPYSAYAAYEKYVLALGAHITGEGARAYGITEKHGRRADRRQIQRYAIERDDPRRGGVGAERT